MNTDYCIELGCTKFEYTPETTLNMDKQFVGTSLEYLIYEQFNSIIDSSEFRKSLLYNEY